MNQIQIRELIRQLEAISKKAQVDIERSPDGTLSLSRVRGKYQFRWRRPGYPLMYLGKSMRDTAAQLAQKDYAQKILVETSKQIKALVHISGSLALLSSASCESDAPPLRLDTAETLSRNTAVGRDAFHRLESIYDHLLQPKKELVIPYITPLRDFITDWESNVVPNSSVFGQGNIFQTAKGELVRSKSEVIIADKLFHAGIPYKYEQPFETQGGTLYPDFVLLDTNLRREIIWEHFGLMDDIDYCNRCAKKLRVYAREGLCLGNGLVATFETSLTPLDTLQVDRIIELIRCNDVHFLSV